jgi:type 1 glutamine amidotransferase
MSKRLFLVALTACLGLPLSRAQDQKSGPDPYDQSKVPLEVEPPAGFKGKKIVLVAGRQSHGPGDHEFFAGTAILMNLLKQTEGVWPVMARDGWPKNEAIFDGAASLVFYMDGRGGHPVVQKDANGNRMDRLQKLMDKGVGWVNLHYAVDYLPQHGRRVLGWMGGYYEPDYSINPHWDAAVRSLPKHPITHGVKPFVLRDEWYYNMRFPEDMKDVTPILTAIPPDNTRGTKAAKMHPGRPEHLAWAYERPGGGRGFGFTGGHFHRNWADENFRRLVVNAILWTAHVEVPDGGAKVDFDPADLNRNLDRKKGAFKPITPPPGRTPQADRK